MTNPLKQKRFKQNQFETLVPAPGLKEIDPTSMSKEDQKLLRTLLEKKQSSSKANNVIKRGKHTVKVEENGKIIKKTFFLRYSLIRREKTVYEDNEELIKASRYSVLGDDFIGEGSFGTVYNILGTLKFADYGLSFSNKHPRVDKAVIGLEDALRETYVLQLISHAKAKNLSIEDQVYQLSHLTMAALGDMDLKTFFDTKLEALSLAQRYLLANNLVWALKEQVHDYRFRHGDIKPANIRIDSNTLEVFFVDYGKAIEEKHFPYHRNMGTPLYMSSEEAYPGNEDFDYKTDMYALGLVLSELFNAKRREGRQSEIKKNALKPQVFNNLFVGLDAHQKDKEDIEKLLHQMTSPNRKERPLPADCRGFFDALYVAEKTKDADDAAIIKAAYQAGRDLYDQCYVYFDSIRSAENSAAIKQAIHQAINQLLSIPDLNDAAVQAFVEAAKIKVFNGLTPTQMQSQIENITSTLDTQIDQLTQFQNQLMQLHSDYKKLLLAFSQMPGIRGEYAQHALKMFADLKVAWYELRHKQVTRENKLDDWAYLAQVYAARLPGLMEKANALQLWLTSEHHQKLQNYKKIYDALKTVTPETDAAATLKNIVKTAIIKYLDGSLTSDNVHNATSAVSGARYKDILAVITILKKDNTPEQLLQALHNHLKNVTSTRFFESTFKKQLLKVVGRYEKEYYQAEQTNAPQQK